MPFRKAEFVGSGPPDGKGVSIKFPKLPGLFSKLFVVIVLAVIVVGVILNLCFVYVHPDEYGVKEVKIGVNRGIQDEAYGPGYSFVLPFGLERIHRLPRKVQVLELTVAPPKDPRTRLSASRYYDQAAKIQLSDGFSVDVDVTVLYRIDDPVKVIKTLGPGKLYLHNGILPKAEPILKQAFGELTTEQFYKPERVEKALKARDLLDEEMASKGVRVEQVLVRYFKYSEQIQRNIEAKKLQDQMVFKNQAQARAATEEAELVRVQREGEKRVAVTLEEGKAYTVTKKAEADLYVEKKHAEADLAVELANAKRIELENDAMQVAGSDKMVAMRMAEVLAGLDTIVVPSGGEQGLNPLDLDNLLSLFGAEGKEAR